MCCLGALDKELNLSERLFSPGSHLCEARCPHRRHDIEGEGVSGVIEVLDGKNMIYVYENTMKVTIMRDYHMHNSLVVAKVPENEKKLYCL